MCVNRKKENKPLYLITTADERTWKTDRPVLFLGEWCCRYNRKDIWSKLDYKIAEPFGVDSIQKRNDVRYTTKISEQLLPELTRALNALHNKNYSLRYWKIVLGHWLQRYVDTFYNRYRTLQDALAKHNINNTSIIDSPDGFLVANDSLAFIWACNNDVWNHVLYSKILNFLGGEVLETGCDIQLDERTCFLPESNKVTNNNKSIKKNIIGLVRNILKKFVKPTDAFILNSYMPLSQEITLQIMLKQFPQLWKVPSIESLGFNKNIRNQLSFDLDNYQGFERIVRYMLNEVMPCCFIEDYNIFVETAEKMSWPSNPKFIFTSNNFDMDELFKYWTANKVEKNIRYFTGQHGNNYGTHFYSGTIAWPERSAADKFFTWGWNDNIKNTIPAFNFKLSGKHNIKNKSDGGLLLIENCVPHQITPWDSYYEYNIYQEEQYMFVSSLPDNIKQCLTIRLHHSYDNFSWYDKDRWSDFDSEIFVDNGTYPLKKMINQSRLVVHSYDSTGILETLAQNIPTVCFWVGEFEHLLDDAKPYYQLLLDENIIFTSPESAAQHIAKYWDKISEWWETNRLQKARETFCNNYSLVDKCPVKTMKNLLTENLYKGLP